MLHMSLQEKSTSNLYVNEFTNIILSYPLMLGTETPLVSLYYLKVMCSKISPPYTRSTFIKINKRNEHEKISFVLG